MELPCIYDHFYLCEVGKKPSWFEKSFYFWTFLIVLKKIVAWKVKAVAWNKEETALALSLT